MKLMLFDVHHLIYINIICINFNSLFLRVVPGGRFNDANIAVPFLVPEFRVI